MNNIKFIKWISALLFTSSCARAMDPWVTDEFPFDTFDLPSTEQSQRWATCAATFEIISDVIRSQGNPAAAKSVAEFSNGSKTAIITILIMGVGERKAGESNEDFRKRFKNAKDYGVFASEEYPKSRKNSILGMRELTENKADWESAAIVSFKRCSKKKSLEIQQGYIDGARSLLLGVGG
jgi:hypothetical protein